MWTASELAKKLNISSRTVRRIAQSLGYQRKGRDYVFSDEQAAAIKARIGRK